MPMSFIMSKDIIIIIIIKLNIASFNIKMIKSAYDNLVSRRSRQQRAPIVVKIRGRFLT